MIATGLVLGYLLISRGGERLVSMIEIVAQGQEVDGTVVEKRTSERVTPMGSDIEILVRFSVPDGGSHEVWAVDDTAVGETLRVHYADGRPDEAVITPVVHLLTAALATLAGVVVLFLLTFLPIRYHWQSVRRRRAG